MCVPLNKRCDGDIDCFDASDELCDILLPLPRFYKPTMPPRKQIPLTVSLELKSVSDVSISRNKITLWLKVWFRINYKCLKTELSKFLIILKSYFDYININCR